MTEYEVGQVIFVDVDQHNQNCRATITGVNGNRLTVNVQVAPGRGYMAAVYTYTVVFGDAPDTFTKVEPGVYKIGI